MAGHRHLIFDGICVYFAMQTDTSERVQCPLDSKRSDVVAGYKTVATDA